MPDFDDLRRRIDALCARASAEHPDARLLVEIEDVLAEGYMCALYADHHRRRLQRRFDELVASSDRIDELHTVAREHRSLVEATRELRSRLVVVREHWVALGSERLGLA